MFGEWLSFVPPWLVVGVALGAAASIGVAGLFYAGDRFFPSVPTGAGPRVDGTVRRRAEIRDYLRAIDEPFAEDYSLGGATVAFYLPVRDVAITFDAQAYFRLRGSDVYVVLCEHEMPGRHLGRRLPFEVPELRPEPAVDPVGDAFRRLGLTRDADEQTVRKAYRKKVMEVHPDQGGDEEEFKRVREAYATARNHAQRSA